MVVDIDEYEYDIGVLRRYINGESIGREWDDFTTIKHKDKLIDSVRSIASLTIDVFPPVTRDRYTSDDGVKVLDMLKNILVMAVQTNRKVKSVNKDPNS